jgi:hypothetical protein
MTWGGAHARELELVAGRSAPSAFWHQTPLRSSRRVGVLTETTGRRRDRTFSYSKYLDHLRVGTELE